MAPLLQSLLDRFGPLVVQMFVIKKKVSAANAAAANWLLAKKAAGMIAFFGVLRLASWLLPKQIAA